MSGPVEPGDELGRGTRNAPPEAAADPEVDCCVVGGGPGGLLAGYLLARAGASVRLLESHADFDRRFRGDSLHPWTLELMEELGLVEGLLRLEHYKARAFRFYTLKETVTAAEYARLPGRYPYVALMPQDRFLTYLAAQAEQLSGFALTMRAKVTGLVETSGVVRGVRYQASSGDRVQPARVVIAADGRFSKMRRLANMTAEPLGAATDLLWFELPRRAADPADADVSIYLGPGHYVGVLGRPTTWQVGYTQPKGTYAEARAAGVAPIREFVATHVPWLADRAPLLTDWSQLTLLSVEIARVPRWHRPGLLLIGDAAHVISPVGGNGILMALQDAVVAANELAPALRDTGAPVPEKALARVQAQRDGAIRKVQAEQVRVERQTTRLLGSGLNKSGSTATETTTRFPLLLRLLSRSGWVRARGARSNAYGPNPPVLDPSILTAPVSN